MRLEVRRPNDPVAAGDFHSVRLSGAGWKCRGAIIVSTAGAIILGLTMSACADDESDPSRDEATHVTTPTTAGIRTVRVGDCLANLDTGDFRTVDEMPCAQPHGFEVFSARLLQDGAFPGDEGVLKSATDFCRSEFEGFVGVRYDDSDLTIQPIVPTEDSWSKSDREIVCLVGVGDGRRSTGSLRDAHH